MPCPRSSTDSSPVPKEGDAKATFYLCDRILGKTAPSATAPADNRQAPYTEEDFQEDQQEHEELFGFLKARQPSGARNDL
jgi:hypothetical protein